MFDLSTNRELTEAFGLGDFVVKDSIDLSWQHGTERIKSKLSFGFSESTYERDVGGRKDDLLTFGASVTYDFRRWAEFGAGYNYSERDSSNNNLDYKRNIANIFATVKF